LNRADPDELTTVLQPPERPPTIIAVPPYTLAFVLQPPLSEPVASTTLPQVYVEERAARVRI